jgi:hypothetical protein
LIAETASQQAQVDRLIFIVSRVVRGVLILISLVCLYEIIRDAWRMIRLRGRRLTP